DDERGHGIHMDRNRAVVSEVIARIPPGSLRGGSLDLGDGWQILFGESSNDQAFLLSQSRTTRSSSVSGSLPLPSTRLWYPLSENRAPIAFLASSRRSRSFICPILYEQAWPGMTTYR